MHRLLLVLGLLAVAGILGFIAIGFGAAALYLFFRSWLAAPLAALATSVASVVVAMLLLRLAGRSGRAGVPSGSSPITLIRAYPLESTAIAFTAGFLMARSKDAARIISERFIGVMAMLLRNC